MRAWRVGQPGPMRSGPLVADECPDPRPGPGEVLVRVRVCGVCRTDLHLAEGDLAPRHPGVIPGHEVVGEVVALRAARHAVLARRPGRGRLARRHLRRLPLLPARRREPLPRPPRSPAGTATAATRNSSRWPRTSPTGSRRASRTRRPRRCCARASSATARSAGPSCRPAAGWASTASAGRAHLAAQIALHRGARVYVMTRSAEARSLALELGATFAGGADEQPPDPLDSAILFAPAGGLVPVALGPWTAAARSPWPAST